MLVEKEIIAPGEYWYTDPATNLPRKLTVTPEMAKHWHDDGNKMLSLGLTVPVPCEHDFEAHPMTPADKLKSNAGWVREYRIKDAPDGRKGVLFGVVDIQDEDIAKKLPRTIRWTSPWINSFTDGDGRKWENVISHLALTTRPRITKQAPFTSIAAALSIATDHQAGAETKDGLCISRAGRLMRSRFGALVPMYPIAFSLMSGVPLGGSDMLRGSNIGGQVRAMWFNSPLEPDEFKEYGVKRKTGRRRKKKKGKAKAKGRAMGVAFAGEDDNDEYDYENENDPPQDGEEYEHEYEMEGDNPTGDVKMEELLCDLLQALGVPMPDDSNEDEFKRHLYEAAMSKIKELTSKGEAAGKPDNPKPPDQPNPILQQEQQPMYMSLEEINKLPEPMKGVALAMYAENQKLRTEMESSKKITDSLRDARLKEAAAQRATRVAMLGKLSPKVKADLDAMLALPAMALSMGDGGTVVDPMAQTLAMLEKGLADIPAMLLQDRTALSVVPQPTDAEALTDAKSTEIADGLSRMMGCPPEQKKAS